MASIRVVTVDEHLHRTPDITAVFPGIQSDNLAAMPAISDALRKMTVDPSTVVVGPDEESLPWVSDLAGRLDLPYAVARKTRRGDRSVAIEFQDRARIAGRPALIVDDIVSSGGTIVACAKALTAAGATAIDAVVTHALFPEAACRELVSAGFVRSVQHKACRISPMPLRLMTCSPMP
jgi:ribose-phosphate pyrophosphokinase